MSINIITKGMFKSCCGPIVGGAPPYRPDDKKPKINISVTKVGIKTKNKSFNIEINLLDNE